MAASKIDGEHMNDLLWANLNAAALRDLASRDGIVIVPVGSMEQHGPHLPVQVDALLATEVSTRAAHLVRSSAPVVVAPTVWCGLAEHHMVFGGTITLDYDTFRALLRCVCSSVVRHGFRRVMLLNGHGGNVAALNVVTGELGRELDAPIATATYWLLTEAAREFDAVLDEQRNVRHACEAETSMLLAIAPDLVDREAMRSVRTTTAEVLTPGGAYRYRSFAELSDSGVIGFPAAASADKGERLLDIAARALASTLLGGEMW